MEDNKVTEVREINWASLKHPAHGYATDWRLLKEEAGNALTQPAHMSETLIPVTKAKGLKTIRKELESPQCLPLGGEDHPDLPSLLFAHCPKLLEPSVRWLRPRLAKTNLTSWSISSIHESSYSTATPESILSNATKFDQFPALGKNEDLHIIQGNGEYISASAS